MLKKMYEQMLLIREFEEVLTSLFHEGLLFGTTHCCIGQEAVAVGVLSATDSDDVVVSNHRGHGHFIAFTDDVEGLMAEIMGRETGVCGGRGGSQHLHTKNFYNNGITGGMAPIATGMALAEKIKGSGKKVISFLGDGALAQGVVYESWNMAQLWKLPILYIIENNQYAMSTHISKHFAGDICERAKGFNFKTTRVTNESVEEIYKVTKKIISEMNHWVIPQILVCDTFRYCGHSKSDDLCYRSREEEALWLEKDPIIMLGAKLSIDNRNIIIDRVKKRIQNAIRKSESSSFQDRKRLLL